MVRLPTFIDALAAYDGRTRSTIDVLSRELRSEGWLAPTKRGVGASHLSAYEASNLLIASMATDSPAAGPRAVEVYRTLKARPSPHPESKHGAEAFAMKSAETFGDALEILMGLAADAPWWGFHLKIARPVPYAAFTATNDVGLTVWKIEWQVDPVLLMQGFYGPETQNRPAKVTATTMPHDALIGLANLLAGQREEKPE